MMNAMITVVLGAGFSRAISDHMPLTLDLGREIRRPDMDPIEYARIPDIKSGVDLERWLSKIAEPQPYLDDLHNALGTVDFHSATAIIQSVLVDRQYEVTSEEMPDWLRTFVRFLHSTHSDVITFNYDTLLEQALCRVLNDDLGSSKTYLAPVKPQFRGDRMPPLYVAPRRGVPEEYFVQEPSIRLTKLHGSVDAWWVPGDETGSTIGSFGPLSWGERSRDHEWDPDLRPTGRSPFIIPPVSSKSPFYKNPVTRHLWRDAANSLADAERVSIVGYSVPMTDLTTASMLEHTLSGDGAVKQIDVVDPFPEGVCNSLESLGISSNLIKTFNSVPEWVDDLIQSELGGSGPAIVPFAG